jgi:hypothetical protein
MQVLAAQDHDSQTLVNDSARPETAPVLKQRCKVSDLMYKALCIQLAESGTCSCRLLTAITQISHQ